MFHELEYLFFNGKVGEEKKGVKDENREKVFALLLALVTVISCNGLRDAGVAQAETKTADVGFSLDEKIYSIKWYETEKIFVKQTYATVKKNKNFKKGTVLGTVKVYAGIATTKGRVNNKYYQRVLVKGKMCPWKVSGNWQGMSQYLKISTNSDNRMLNLGIEPASTSGSTSYSVSGTKSLAQEVSGDLTAKADGTITAKLGKSVTGTFSIGKTVSYAEDSLIIVTNKNNSGDAVWGWDYVSSSSSAKQNAYLLGSSEQYGILSWNMEEGKNIILTGLTVTVTATFGGGNVSSYKRQANNNGSYHLGSATGSVMIWTR